MSAPERKLLRAIFYPIGEPFRLFFLSMIALPGLIDSQMHLREPGATHKEDWDSATAAALAGGFALVFAMPNTFPTVTDGDTLSRVLDAASHKARRDYTQVRAW